MWPKMTSITEVDPLLAQRVEKAKDWHKAIAGSNNALLIFDRSGKVIHHNHALGSVLGHDPATRAPLLSLWHAEYRSLRVLSKIQTAMCAGEAWHGTIYNRRPDGTLYWAAVAIWPLHRSDARDATHFLFVVDAYSCHNVAQTMFDYLTQLPNRGLGQEILDKLLRHAHEHRIVSVLQVRLSGLQEINDVLGYTAVDSILIESARRLYVSDVAPEIIARTGNHDFLLVLIENEMEVGTTWAGRKILNELDMPFEVKGKEISVAARVSVSTAPADGLCADQLLQNCGIAMSTGRDRQDNFTIFTPDMQRRANVRGELSSKLRRALTGNEFSLRYQPLISAQTGEMVGCEALLRWNNPVLGEVSPDRFIRLAEENSLIVPISHWVFARACQQAAAWLREGRNIGRVSINASPLHFQQGNLYEDVKRALDESGLPPECIEIEITESAVMAESQDVIDALVKLVDLGVGLSLDDFGTGYSSLTYLRRYPFQTIKIDRSFVFDLTTNANSRVLIKAIITLAKNLNLRVIAEGVENVEQDAFLRGEGCDVIQGYYYSRPLGADKIGTLMRLSRSFTPALAAVGE